MHIPHARMSSPRYHRDLAGLRFGKWVVKAFAIKKGSSRLWLCRCDCGTEKSVFESGLVSGQSTRCLLCSWRERSKGNRHVKSYVAWTRLRKLGAMVEEWYDYKVFREDMGDPPTENARLRRLDMAVPHSPRNTYWAIPQTPPRLQRKSKKSRTTDVNQHKMLINIRSARTRDEQLRCILAARSEGYTYESIGIAAGISKQAVFQVIRRHANRHVRYAQRLCTSDRG